MKKVWSFLNIFRLQLVKFFLLFCNEIFKGLDAIMFCDRFASSCLVALPARESHFFTLVHPVILDTGKAYEVLLLASLTVKNTIAFSIVFLILLVKILFWALFTWKVQVDEMLLDKTIDCITLLVLVTAWRTSIAQCKPTVCASLTSKCIASWALYWLKNNEGANWATEELINGLWDTLFWFEIWHFFRLVFCFFLSFGFQIIHEQLIYHKGWIDPSSTFERLSLPIWSRCLLQVLVLLLLTLKFLQIEL